MLRTVPNGSTGVLRSSVFEFAEARQTPVDTRAFRAPQKQKTDDDLVALRPAVEDVCVQTLGVCPAVPDDLAVRMPFASHIVGRRGSGCPGREECTRQVSLTA